jgi:hypothetical protein
MRNPWIKKNPFMSMWLSGANAMLAFALGQAQAATRRHIATMATAGTRSATSAKKPRRRKSTKSAR